jgi:hypothetical protein
MGSQRPNKGINFSRLYIRQHKVRTESLFGVAGPLCGDIAIYAVYALEGLTVLIFTSHVHVCWCA